MPKTPITAWQISNEPNSQMFWKPAPSPPEYADLLQMSSAAIKAVDPGAAIVLAGMFGTPQSGIAAWDFLEGVYAVPGAQAAFDAYALHPYAPNLRGIEAQLGLARKVVKANGDQGIPLLITEIGWPTAGPEGYNLVKSPTAQKRLLVDAFKLFLKQRRNWKLERVIWYTWRDNEVAARLRRLPLLRALHRRPRAEAGVGQVHPVRRRPALSDVRPECARRGRRRAGAAGARRRRTGCARPPPADDFYGVTSATELEPSEYERMGGGGIGTLRVPLFWPFIEPKAPQRPADRPRASRWGCPRTSSRWGPTDEIVERAARNGIRVLPFVYGSPDWVAGGDFERPPIDDAEARAAWQDFLGDLVGRYGPGGEFWEELAFRAPGIEALPITDWQIWNEANSPVFWHPRPSAAEYREVVALAADAIRAADPAATIVLGGMFGSPTKGVRAWDFLEQFLADPEIAGSFDAYALHPYAPNLDGIASRCAACSASPPPARTPPPHCGSPRSAGRPRDRRASTWSSRSTGRSACSHDRSASS